MAIPPDKRAFQDLGIVPEQLRIGGPIALGRAPGHSIV